MTKPSTLRQHISSEKTCKGGRKKQEQDFSQQAPQEFIRITRSRTSSIAITSGEKGCVIKREWRLDKGPRQPVGALDEMRMRRETLEERELSFGDALDGLYK